jgi:hypothetical protein
MANRSTKNQKMKYKRNWIVLSGVVGLVIVLMIFGVFSAANTRKNAAQKHTGMLISEMVNHQTSLITKTDGGCSTSANGIIKLVFRHRSCVSSMTKYYAVDGNLNDIKKSLYSSATAKGWFVLDSGKLDNYRFSSNNFGDNYLDASSNRNPEASNLTVRLLPSDKINLLGELSPDDKAQLKSETSKSAYIIRINVSTVFEG